MLRMRASGAIFYFTRYIIEVAVWVEHWTRSACDPHYTQLEIASVINHQNF